MRYCWIGLLFLSMGSCVEKKEKGTAPVKIDNTARLTRSDSFDVADLQMESDLDPVIVIDTISFEGANGHVGLSLHIPRIDSRSLSIVYRFIDSLGRIQKSNFRDDVSAWNEDYGGEPDSVLLGSGLSRDIRPKLLYSDSEVVSLMFEQYESRGMAGNFEYRGINYDRIRKKRIGFSDYFRLDTPTDSAFWRHIMLRVVDPPEQLGNVNFIENPPVKFAFNKDDIYFFFDRFELLGIGLICGIKKKYVSEYIREEYR